MTAIDHRSLGAAGPLVSTIGLGCNNFGRRGTRTESQDGTTAVLDEAIELGVTLLDTADIYGGSFGQSETLMGHALEGKRDRVVLATKFGHQEFSVGIEGAKGSRAYIRTAIEGSLRRLRTDRVDLYQLHTPDPVTPIAETIAALDELVVEGKILNYGHSNFSAEQIAEAALAGGRFVSAQSEYSLVAREVEKTVLPAVLEFGLGFLPYFPLANGLFTGKFSRTERPSDTRIMRQRPHVVDNAPWDAIEEYERLCQSRGITILQATFAWLLAQPGLTSVIAGATSPEQLAQNAAASTTRLSDDDVAEISRIFSRAG